ncbi:hypothetical protein D3C87_171250 [compost metagenome]
MSKLSGEEIQFIDNYLYNSGVRYIDIRCEMTDHVATALEAMEGDFGQNFSRYMISNKKELLFGNKKFKGGAMSRAWVSFWTFYTNPKFLIGMALLALFSFIMVNHVGYEEVYSYFFLSNVFVFFGFYILWVYFWVAKKNRYSVIDRLLLISWFIPAFFRFEGIIKSETLKLILIVLYSSIVSALFLTIINVHRKYKLRYNG